MELRDTMDRTLVIAKTDAVARGIVGQIITRFEEKGILIAGMKMLKLDDAAARRMYAVHEGKYFYEPLIRYISRGPIVAVIAEGRGVIEIVRAMAGATFGSAAAPGTIRGDFAVSNRYNIIHASDSKESFANEWPIFFRPEEIISPDPSRYAWVYDSSGGDIL